MKRQPYDYRGFSLRRLGEPRFRHLLLLGGWIGYFALYFLTENLIPADRCHVIHCALDDAIPFCEYFLIFYVGWYFLVFGALAYTLFYDVEGFRRLQKYIMITQAAAMLVYIFYPSIQLLRPAAFPRRNVFTRILGVIYWFDTPTGVFPSLHVAYSLGIASVWCKEKDVHIAWKLLIVALVALISISTAFVKQHSVVDIFAALPVGLLAEAILYGKYWKEKLRRVRR